MIRICHLITDLQIAGAERNLVELATRLNPNQFCCEIVTLFEPGPLADSALSAGIPVTSLETKFGRPRAAAVTRLTHHLRKSRPTILQTWLYYADLIGLIGGRLAGTPYIVWNLRCSRMAAVGEYWRLQRRMALFGLLSRLPNAVIVNSRAGLIHHSFHRYRPRRWIEIANGVDLVRFRPRPGERLALRAKFGLRSDATIIGMVARNHPMKDHLTFLRAASLFASRHPNSEFVLSGKDCIPEAKPLKELIAAFGLESRVHLLGVRLDINDLYPTFDIATLSSAYGEGCPNTLLEAMACEIPVVATDVGDSAHILGSEGLIVRPQDPESLASGWTQLLSAASARAGLRGRARALKLFSIEQSVRNYEEAYLDLIKGSS